MNKKILAAAAVLALVGGGVAAVVPALAANGSGVQSSSTSAQMKAAILKAQKDARKAHLSDAQTKDAIQKAIEAEVAKLGLKPDQALAVLNAVANELANNAQAQAAVKASMAVIQQAMNDANQQPTSTGQKGSDNNNQGNSGYK